MSHSNLPHKEEELLWFFVCLWEIIILHSGQYGCIILQCSSLTSNRSEGRCIASCLVLIMHVCEACPLPVAAVEFVIFEARLFTNYLGRAIPFQFLC